MVYESFAFSKINENVRGYLAKKEKGIRGKSEVNNFVEVLGAKHDQLHSERQPSATPTSR